MPDFKFRLPSINDLTDLQQIAFYENRPILVTGGPGSGKTVVTIFRFLRQITENQNAIFFTFNRTLMSSIRGTLRQQAEIRLPSLKPEEIEEIIDTKITSMFEWYGAAFSTMLSEDSDETIDENFSMHRTLRLKNKRFSELFIDESQDLRPGIVSAAYKIGEKVTCGADRAQDIQGHYTGPADDMIFAILNQERTTVRQGLTSNFRNTKEIFEFARKFVPEDQTVQQIDTSDFPAGDSPEIIGDLDENQQFALILQIIQDNPNSNIGILLHTKQEIFDLKGYLEKNGYSCAKDVEESKSFSYYYSNMPFGDRLIMEKKLRTPFILSFESCKGLEFDIVIMGKFEDADWALTKFKKNNGNVEYDANGNPRCWATINHYYVAATRARSNLYILYHNKPDVLAFWEDASDNTIFDDEDLPF